MKRAPLSCVSATLCLLWLTKFAAPTQAAEINLAEVVVSATRVQRSEFDVPATIDVVRIADRPNALGVNLSDYLGSLVGASSRSRENHAQDEQLSIRGFGARAQFGIVGVRIYVDGIPATMPDGQGQVSHINFDSAERIEVLRGPFSALYGNASGGVVQVYTKPGNADGELRGSLQGGSADTWRESLNISDLQHGLAYNLNYTHFTTNGWREHSTARRDSGNLRLDFSPLSGNQLTLIANRLSSPDAQDNGSLTLAQFNDDARQAAPTALQFDTRKSLDQTQFGLRDDQVLSDTQSLQLTTYVGQRDVIQTLSTPVVAQSSDLSPGGVVDLDNRYYGGDAHWQTDTVLLGGKLSVVAGVSYDVMHSERRGYNNFIGSTLGVIGTLRRDETNRLYDFDQYLQADWDVSARWSTLIGLRHNAVHFDSQDRYITSSNPDDSGTTRYAAWTPAASALFRANRQLHFYAAWGRALDTPTFANLAYRPDGGSGLNLELRAARTDNAELGAKWRSENLSANIALFHAITRDELAVASAQGGRSTYRNVDRTLRQGFEGELELALNAHWRTQLAYGWIDARYRDSFRTCTVNGCLATAGVLIPAGNRIPGVSRSTLHAALNWQHAAWNVALDTHYLSRVAVNDANSEYAPTFGLIGLNGGYLREAAHWRGRAFLRIDNVFDRRYVSTVVANDINNRFYQPGAGRSAYAGFSLAWLMK